MEKLTVSSRPRPASVAPSIVYFYRITRRRAIRMAIRPWQKAAMAQGAQAKVISLIGVVIDPFR
ncbi:MAG: hypothetical protein ACOH1R_10130 [Luteimonas sp.]